MSSRNNSAVKSRKLSIATVATAQLTCQLHINVVVISP
jgi:hypothetical protein